MVSLDQVSAAILAIILDRWIIYAIIDQPSIITLSLTVTLLNPTPNPKWKISTLILMFFAILGLIAVSD